MRKSLLKIELFMKLTKQLIKKNGWSLSIFSKSLAGKELNIFCVLRQHKVIEQQKITEICKPTDIKYNKSVEKDYTFLIKKYFPF